MERGVCNRNCLWIRLDVNLFSFSSPAGGEGCGPAKLVTWIDVSRRRSTVMESDYVR